MSTAQRAPQQACQPSSNKTNGRIGNEDLIKRLMAHFTVRYPGTFAQSVNTPHLQALFLQDWSAGLSNFGWERISIALKRCAKRANDQFCPSLGTFIALCEPDYGELRMPEPEDAYAAACRGKFDHDAVWFAAKKVGADRLRKLAETTTRPEFMKAYAMALEKLRGNEILPNRPAPVTQIEKQPRTPEQIEQDRIAGANALRDMRQKLGVTSV